MKKLLPLFIISLLVSSCMIPNDISPKLEGDKMARSPQDQGSSRSDVVSRPRSKTDEDQRRSEDMKK